MKDNGGPAFPGGIDHGASGIESFTGMTLRDWFAGQAMIGLVANPKFIGPSEMAAMDAYEFADAMLKERT